MAVIADGQAKEDSSAVVQFQLYDPIQKAQISGSNIISASMTIVDKITGDELLAATDVKANFNAAGDFLKILDPAVCDFKGGDELDAETHVAVLTIVANTGNGQLTLKEELWINVINNKKIV